MVIEGRSSCLKKQQPSALYSSSEAKSLFGIDSCPIFVCEGPAATVACQGSECFLSVGVLTTTETVEKWNGSKL